jgi:hypothetical protein
MTEYRNYVMEDHPVKNHYREMREKQTIIYVLNMVQKWSPTVIPFIFNIISPRI